MKEFENHLVEILTRFRIRTDVINHYIVDRYTFKFHDDVSDERRYDYYRWVCKQFKIKPIKL